jgi:hypothetical protein
MIKEFRAIIERDRGGVIKGDSDGRRKKLATMELAYVHFITYYNSEFVTSYPEDEREYRIKKHLGLPDEWKPDAVVELACLTYRSLTNTPSMDALREAREALFSADKILAIFRKRLETFLQDMDMGVTGDDEAENEKKIQQRLDAVDKLYDKVIKTAKNMPEALDVVNKLEERVRKEMAAEVKGKKNMAINEHEL